MLVRGFDQCSVVTLPAVLIGGVRSSYFPASQKAEKEVDAPGAGGIARQLEGGSLVGIGNASSIDSAGRIPEQTAIPVRILQGHPLRTLVTFALRWLVAFSAGD